MDDNEAQIKGWPAAVLGVLVVLGGGAYLVAFPGFLHSRERRAIIQKLEDERASELASSVEALKKDVTNQAQLNATLQKGRESLKKIELASATVRPRGLSWGKRVKVQYTVGGEKPKKDGGVRYFRVTNRRGGGGTRSYHVYDISKKRFESWW